MKENSTVSLFGQHLMLDISSCNKETLSDYNLVFKLLHELPQLLDMHALIQPYVFPYSGLIPQDKGVTGILIIAESHATIHTFSEKDYVFIDVFSCKSFDISLATEYFVSAFGARTVSKNVTERGIGFPRD